MICYAISPQFFVLELGVLCFRGCSSSVKGHRQKNPKQKHGQARLKP